MSNTAKYFIDAEFIEDGVTIDLISIGIVSEDDREYYALNFNCDHDKASQWVKDNVLNCIPPKPTIITMLTTFPPKSIMDVYGQDGYKSKKLIGKEIIKFCNLEIEKPLFWGEWPSYDWVAFCQLFGTMMDLPKGFPMRCNDIIQLAEHLGFTSEDLPESLETEGNHNALLGAKTVKMRYEWLLKRQ
jgi:hypothetical protein